jgi:DNA-binding NtrC family response regulator
MTSFVFGTSSVMLEIERRIDSIAPSALPVMLWGEIGTGKEALAKELWNRIGRQGDFVRLYCGGARAEMLEQSLSAASLAAGSGDHSVLFLKHVHLLPRPLQQRLLTEFQNGGASGKGYRLVCSALEPLEPLVARGEFLADLRLRIAVWKIGLPPLRERPVDVPLLFQALAAAASGSPRLPPPSPGLLRALQAYPWPGNVRELQSVAHNYAASREAGAIIAELERRSHMLEVKPASVEDGLSLKDQVRRASQALESQIILRALERHRWNRRRTAQTLRISYRALLYKMKSCNLRSSQVENTPVEQAETVRRAS